MKHSVTGRDSLKSFGFEEDVARAVTRAVTETAVNMKDLWRQQIVQAGLGPRLARAVRHKVFPERENSVDAAALVFARKGRTEQQKGAAGILSAYVDGATIVPGAGKRFLAIPTDDVPKQRRGNRLTPAEVEARFGRPLIAIRPDDYAVRTTPSQLRGRGAILLGFRGLSIRRNSGRWRNATRNERTPGSRSYREVSRAFVVMFILVPIVRVAKRLDLDALQREVTANYPGLLTKHWDKP